MNEMLDGVGTRKCWSEERSVDDNKCEKKGIEERALSVTVASFEQSKVLIKSTFVVTWLHMCLSASLLLLDVKSYSSR